MTDQPAAATPTSPTPEDWPTAPKNPLKEHFDAIPADQQAGGWDALWQKSITHWDRHAPSPALIDTLAEHAATLGPSLHASSGTRKRALVPGCGKGYDVFLLAAHGYDAYGLDVSETALARAAELQAAPSFATEYPVADERVGQGTATLLQEDFFLDDFLARTGGVRFDLIYDYTFLCALPPVTRPQWARRMSQLLAPEGRLVCLEWPLHKNVQAGGPPHGLESVVYERLFEKPGAEVRYDAATGKVEKGDGEMAEDALIRMEHWRAQRTHKEGKGVECVSIWRHRQGAERSCAECE
nr:putative thiol methyltransferase 2 [Quercus suber]